jgi:hypothetical protein
VDDRFGPDLFVQVLTRERDPLLRHTAILNAVCERVGYSSRSMRLLSWNMGHREAHWRDVTADDEVDVALLQEAVPPPAGAVHETVPAVSERWVTAGADRRFCAAIARLSNRVNLRPIPTKPLADAGRDELGVSLPGTLAAGEVTDASGEQITAGSKSK